MSPLVILFAAGLAAAPTPAPEFILLRPGTDLLPPAGIDAGVPPPVNECCAEADAARTLVVRYVAENAAFFEIETLGEEPDPGLHCGVVGGDDRWFLHQLSAYRLRLRVARAAALTVLSSPQSLSFADGTAAQLGAGLPVEREPESGLTRFGLFHTTQVFSIGLPGEAVAFRYRPGQVPPRKSGFREDRRLSEGTIGEVGPDGVVFLPAGWNGLSKKAGAGRSLLEINARCAQLVARVSTAVLRKERPARQSGTLRVHGCLESGGWQVREGAPVSWPDGRPAGVTTQTDRFEELTADGRRRCSKVRLQGSYSLLSLCFEAADTARISD